MAEIICGLVYRRNHSVCFHSEGFFPPLVSILALAGGDSFRFWQLLTAAFLEGCPYNLLFFALLLLFIGIPLEHEWSRKNMIMVYLLAALVSNAVFLPFLPPERCFFSPGGAFAGLLGAAFCHIGGQDISLFGFMDMKLKTLIAAIVAMMVIVGLFSGSLAVASIPISGFITGILYFRLGKKRQKRGAAPKVSKKRNFSNIEID